MNNPQKTKFQFINHNDPSEADRNSVYNSKNRFAQFDAKFNSNAIFSNLSWNSLEMSSVNHSKSNDILNDSQEAQKDKKIKKLTKINKHLLQKLKQLNDHLTKKLQKQKFKIPRKSNNKNQSRNQENSKQFQGIKKQLQNAYNQIELYKQTINLLKAKQLPKSQQGKMIDQNQRLRQKNQDIEKIQHELKVQKTIKANQQKQLQKINNLQMTEVLTKLDEQILNAKTKLKETKKNFTKKEQLEKKQHMYYLQIQTLLKKLKNSQDQNQQNFIQSSINQLEEQVPKEKWEETKKKLAEQRKKYEEYGKKITYHNYIKSKLTKAYDELQLKFKQKSKILEKLNSKMNEVNKLVRLKPKIELSQRVNLKMEKLKDIIERQGSIQLNQINKIKSRALSQDVRQFKKWQIQHAMRENDFEQIPQKIRLKLQSYEESPYSNQFDNILSISKNQLQPLN